MNRKSNPRPSHWEGLGGLLIVLLLAACRPGGGAFTVDCTKPVTQIWLFFPRNPVLVLLWGLLMTLGVSVILDTLVKKIMP